MSFWPAVRLVFLKPSSVTSITMRGETRCDKAKILKLTRRRYKGFVSTFVFLLPALVLLCLLEAALVQAGSYSWGGPGTNSDNGDPSPENGERFIYKGYLIIRVCASTLKQSVSPRVFSVSHGPGVVRLLSDAATDTQDEEVL